MRFVSWNVNGLRACMQKGFLETFQKLNADFFCLQETKLQAGQLVMDLPGYEQYWCYADKKGYSGTAIFAKHKPLSVSYGLGIPELDTEGRLITLEYPEFYLVTCYTPNAQRGLVRIDHRMKWEGAFREYLMMLDTQKPVIICGDLNVAHQNIDLKNPSSNRGSAGFSDEERACFSTLLESGFTDTFRYLNPTATGAYTWWSYMFKARQNNAGWRIDYFLVSDRLQDCIYSAPIYPDIMGSDHCPVGLDLEIGCNGGMWWSSEETADKSKSQKSEKPPKKHSSGVSAAAAVLSVAFLLLVGLFAWQALDIPPSEPTTGPEILDSHPTLPSWHLETVFVTIPDFDEKPVNVRVMESEHWVTNMEPMLSSLFVPAFTDGNTVWKLETFPGPSAPPGSYTPGGDNYWVQVTARNPEAMNSLLLGQCYLSLTDAAGHESEYISGVNCVRYYDSYGRIAGWFLYGFTPRDTTLSIEICTQDGNPLYREKVSIHPIITAVDASEMPEKMLLDYVLHTEVTRNYESADPELCFTNYCLIAEQLPGFWELLVRNNSAGLEEYTPGCPECAEAKRFLETVFPYYNAHYARYADKTSIATLQTQTTEELLTGMQQNVGFAEYIIHALANNPNPHDAYQDLRRIFPALWELETREDACSVLLDTAGENYVSNFILVQPIFLQQLTIAQTQQYLETCMGGSGIESISTEDLVYVISSPFQFYTCIYMDYPYNYGQLLQYFPPMQELENRSDAIDVMLSFLTGENEIATSNQRLFITALLDKDIYQAKMTDSQKELFLANRYVIKF